MTCSLSEKNLIVMLFIKNQALKITKDELSADKKNDLDINKNDLDIIIIVQTRNMIENNFKNIKKYLDTYFEIECITQILAIINSVKEYSYYKQTRRKKKVVRKW